MLLGLATILSWNHFALYFLDRKTRILQASGFPFLVVFHLLVCVNVFPLLPPGEVFSHSSCHSLIQLEEKRCSHYPSRHERPGNLPFHNRVVKSWTIQGNTHTPPVCFGTVWLFRSTEQCFYDQVLSQMAPFSLLVMETQSIIFMVAHQSDSITAFDHLPDD